MRLLETGTLYVAQFLENGLLEWLPSVSYTHLRAHETVLDLVCRLLLEKKTYSNTNTYKGQQQQVNIYITLKTTYNG